MYERNLICSKEYDIILNFLTYRFGKKLAVTGSLHNDVALVKTQSVGDPQTSCGNLSLDPMGVSGIIHGLSKHCLIPLI